MPRRTMVLPLLAAVAFVAVPTASAQPMTPFGQAIQQLTPGTDLKVLDATGRTLTGRLTQVEADAIHLDGANGIVRLTAEEVRAVFRRERDPIGQGLLAGALIGAGAGAAAGAAGSKHFNEDYIAERDVWYATLGGSLAGLAVGGLWDALVRKDTTVYRRSTDIALGPPTNARGGRGVLVELRW